MRRLIQIPFAFAPALLMLAACGGGAPKPEVPASLAAHYRASLQLPGGELPFGLEIDEKDGKLSAVIVNGPERLDAEDVARDGERITMRLPGYRNTIELAPEGGILRGRLTMVKSGNLRQEIPLVAMRGDSYRFFPAAIAPGGDIGGRWAVTFIEDNGAESIAVGEFSQSGSDVTGTFLSATGDHRYLSGELRGGELFLGSFNGGQTFLYHATVAADGTLSGDYWSGLAYHARFKARRDENASLGDTVRMTSVRDPSQRLKFSFPDLAGQPVSIEDPRFAGKVVVVAISGSWCPNCHDEAAFLSQYYRENRDKGFEVVGLMFEHFDVPAEAKVAVEGYRDRNEVEFPLLIAGITGDTASSRLPQLDAVHAYPTTLFVDRKGKVRYVHTGFSGPATGAHYVELTREFDERIKALLAEPT
jgi:thiol-disulfide isomerase/thioredoxin